MTDIALVLSPDGTSADVTMQNGDLQLDDTLLTAVLWSMLANAPATAAANLPPGADWQGWCLDAFLLPLPDGTPDHLGNDAWLYLRCTATQANANLICAAFQRGLNWMVLDNVAADVTVSGTFSTATELDITTAISQTSSGGSTVTQYFRFLWNNTLGTLTVPAST